MLLLGRLNKKRMISPSAQVAEPYRIARSQGSLDGRSNIEGSQGPLEGVYLVCRSPAVAGVPDHVWPLPYACQHAAKRKRHSCK